MFLLGLIHLMAQVISSTRGDVTWREKTCYNRTTSCDHCILPDKLGMVPHRLLQPHSYVELSAPAANHH